MNDYVNGLKGLIPEILDESIDTHSLMEIRLRVGKSSVFRYRDKGCVYGRKTDQKLFDKVFLSLCGGNVYRHEHTLSKGYFNDILGGRCGVCGTLMYKGDVPFVDSVTSVNIRIPLYIPDLARPLINHFRDNKSVEGTIVFGAPVSGKTTYLRSLALLLSQEGYLICVVDERGEFSFSDYDEQSNIDILSGYEKWHGIDISIRTLSPQIIICDEISELERDDRLRRLFDSGVTLIASAHADSLEQLVRSPWMRYACEMGIFRHYVHMKLCEKEEIGKICLI